MTAREGSTWLLSIMLLVEVSACGGRARGAEPSGVGEGGRDSSHLGGAVAAPAGEAGSKAELPPNEGSGLGGEGPVRPTPVIDSATRYCESDAECFGQACVSPPGQPNICAITCETDADCWRDELCIEAANGSHCYPTCDSPEDCAYAFDCFRFDDAVGLLCFPAPWTAGLR